MTPEEAQAMTEITWKQRAAGAGPGKGYCGWCLWTDTASCEGCPVPVVFKLDVPLARAKRRFPCEQLAQFADYLMSRNGSKEERAAAEAVYQLACEHREQLIAAAYELLKERKDVL